MYLQCSKCFEIFNKKSNYDEYIKFCITKSICNSCKNLKQLVTKYNCSSYLSFLPECSLVEDEKFKFQKNSKNESSDESDESDEELNEKSDSSSLNSKNEKFNDPNSYRRVKLKNGEFWDIPIMPLNCQNCDEKFFGYTSLHKHTLEKHKNS